MDTKINELELKRAGAYEGLLKQVEFMAVGQEKLQRETHKLISALKAPTVRGRWGEIQLKRVVELAGMVEYCDFVQQEEVTGEYGRQRPDMVIRLPGHKSDCGRFQGTHCRLSGSDVRHRGDVRNSKMRGHARQVKTHIAKLAGKSYWTTIRFYA